MLPGRVGPDAPVVFNDRIRTPPFALGRNESSAANTHAEDAPCGTAERPCEDDKP